MFIQSRNNLGTNNLFSYSSIPIGVHESVQSHYQLAPYNVVSHEIRRKAPTYFSSSLFLSTFSNRWNQIIQDKRAVTEANSVSSLVSKNDFVLTPILSGKSTFTASDHLPLPDEYELELSARDEAATALSSYIEESTRSATDEQIRTITSNIRSTFYSLMEADDPSFLKRINYTLQHAATKRAYSE
jgi:hypothetical protein